MLHQNLPAPLLLTAAGKKKSPMPANLVRRLVVPVLLLTLAACGPAAAPTTPEPARALTPQPGGTFHLTVLSSPTHLFPFSDISTANSATVSGTYETLLRYDYSGDFRDELKVLPAIAEKWERKDDTTYLFTLRRGVKFHDGSDVTGEDVVWSINYLRDPANKFRRAPVLSTLDQIELVDPYTVKMTSKGPSPGFIDRITDRQPIVLSKKAFDRGVDFEKEPIGTGPFKVGTWDRRSGATLTKNTAYWDSGKPYLEKVQLFYNFDFAQMIAAFTAKKADVVKVSNKAEFDQIQALTPDAVPDPFSQNNSVSLMLKLDRPPFNDVRVRRAMHLALDRQEMIDTLSFGLGAMDPPGMNGGRGGGWAISQEELAKLPGYRRPKEQDLAEAKRLLAEAGHPNGFKFALQYNATGVTRRASEAQVLAAQLAKVGIQAELAPKEDAIARKAELDGDFAVTLSNFTYDPDSEAWLFWLHSKQAKARSGIDDRELDALIDAQALELDQAKRKGMWIAIQRLLLDKLYVVPMVTHKGFVALQSYVHGWGDNRGGQAVNQSWHETWLEPGKVPAGR